MCVCGQAAPLLVSNVFREDPKSDDVIILLLATKDSPAQLKDLLQTSINTQDSAKSVMQYLFSMFTQDTSVYGRRSTIHLQEK